MRGVPLFVRAYALLGVKYDPIATGEISPTVVLKGWHASL